MSERIRTLHPDPDKWTPTIERSKYDRIRTTILDVLRENEVVAFKELASLVEARLDSAFEGSVGWYVTTVKLDLEARGEIERVPGASPQQLRLAGGRQ